MVRLFLLDQYDDAELDRKKTAAMFAGFITKTAPEEPMMGEAEADPDGAAIASLEPGTMQVLLPGEDVKFSSPADVGGGYEAFQYRTLLSARGEGACCRARPCAGVRGVGDAPRPCGHLVLVAARRSRRRGGARDPGGDHGVLHASEPRKAERLKLSGGLASPARCLGGGSARYGLKGG
jgi:hypothetical protein